MKKVTQLKVVGIGACLMGFYAIFKWKQQEKKTVMVMGYLKQHVQYHKDNNIPFGP